jgi:Rrf2 family protein
MFSTTCQYAIRAVLFLAVQTNEENKLGVDKLSEALEIPKHFLAKILQQLAKQNLISSSKGRNGGFFLSSVNKEEKLLDIIHAIDGKKVFDSCILGLKECSAERPCPYHEYVVELRSKFYYTLKTETIEESAKRIKDSDLSLNF